MSAGDLQSLPVQPPDRRIAYGSEASQFGELRLPPGAGPHPTVVLIHGGCWRADYATLAAIAPMADALKADGIATWSIEYRRLGEPGAGWPGTYLDAGHAIDYLRTLAPQYHLDLTRVVVLGHSAGGHLAMWAGTRKKISPASALYLPDPLPIHAVMNLAGTIYMAENIAHMQEMCSDSIVTKMMGGTPAEVGERYREVSADTFLPLGVAQVLIWGTKEDYVPLTLAERYVSAADRSDDRSRLVTLPDAGHFETVSPLSSTWPVVHTTIRSLLAGK
jgi:acetyl esterase/lipase